jgi:hypothetical protein
MVVDSIEGYPSLVALRNAHGALLAPELPDALCPYLELDAFSEASAERFFGRQELIGRMLERLVDARLVRLAAGETPGDDQVEVAHEALVRNWPTLVDWLEEEKAAIATRRRLESRAAEWARLGRGAAALLDEVEWREAERWLQSAEAQYLGYNPALPAYIAASRAATERAAREQGDAWQHELEQARALGEAQRKLAEAQARTARRLWWATAALAAASYAFILRNIAQTAQAQAQLDATTARTAEAQAQAARADADQQRETVDVQRLAFTARSQLETAAETGLLLAYEVARREANPITEQTLRDALDRYPATVRTLQGHTAFLYSAAFNPDGQRILTASTDSTARLYLVHMEDLLAVAACRVPRSLTDEEIKRFDVGTPSFDFATRQCPPVLEQ